MNQIQQKKKVTGNAQEESTALNRPITAAVGCIDAACGYISREVLVRVQRLQLQCYQHCKGGGIYYKKNLN